MVFAWDWTLTTEIRILFQQTGKLFVLYFFVLKHVSPTNTFSFRFFYLSFYSFSSFTRNEYAFFSSIHPPVCFFIIIFILIDTVKAIGIFLFQPAISFCPFFTHLNFSSSFYLTSIINCSLHSVNHISKINARFRFLFSF